MSVTAKVEPYLHYLAKLLIPLSVVLLGGCDGSGASISININTQSSDSVPQNLSAYPGSGQVTLVWDPVTDASSYTVYWSTEPGVSRIDNAFVVNAPPVTHQGLVNGVTYHYRVSATVFGAESDLSDEQSATPQAWTVATTAANWVRDLKWNGTRFAMVGDSGMVMTSEDGGSWTARTSGSSENLKDLSWDGSQFIAVGDSGTILLSDDGISWNSQNIGSGFNLRGIGSGDSTYLLVGDRIASSETIWHSTTPDNPASWSRASSIPASAIGTPMEAVSWSGTRFVAIGQGGLILTSPDGDSWTVRGDGLTANTLRGVVWGANRFVVVGDGGTILSSPDGITWTKQTSGVLSSLQEVYYDGGLYLAVGANGTILSSADGEGWSEELFAPTNVLYTAGGNATLNVTGGSNGAVYTRGR